ncbi:TonB-dependent receptor [Pseudidiomarina sp. CB1]|uniref:TonB-dependent receptor n=1 Tax=Pseudidiomarina sp. CB1 TaxID=2972484 RepID=UPI0021618A94|nr:TonB-dependent receptor [Pseudidiomarina sp. CB1]
MQKSTLAVAVYLGLSSLATTPMVFAQENQSDAQKSVERITIQGEFRQMTVQEAPTSVTALVAEEVAERGALHLESTLNAFANVNFSGGSSRARFIQIRGVGERSQFVDPIQPSVGLLVDGINYSGLAQAAQLFDISQIEVYRGPQSGRFGADGMAGMMVLESTMPSAETKGVWQLGMANYDALSGGFAVGGDLGALGSGRLSVFQQRDDGFIENTYLNRDDTNKRSERNLRANLYSDLGQDWQLRTTLHALRQDNGYDAFSLDNNRTTLSDEPGEDDLRTRAARLALTYAGWQGAEVELAYAFLGAESVYSYDEDWSYVGIAPGWEYSSFDAYERERDDHTLEARLVSTQPIRVLGSDSDWVLGVYHYRRDEVLTRDFFNWDIGQQDSFSSTYESRHNALYGELTQHLSPEWRITTGARAERYDNPYTDTNGVNETPEDTMWGGRLSLSYLPDTDVLWYATVARGYKAGGVNGDALGKVQDTELTELREYLLARATFAPELLTSLEVGHKRVSADGRLSMQLAVFAHQRDDVQLKGWVNRDQSFVGYLQNAAEGKAYGAEFEVSYRPLEALELFTNIGLLETEIEGFVTEDGVDMSGREQAHAPNYQVNAGVNYQLAEAWQMGLSVDAKDGFYYSDSHMSEADSMAVVNAYIRWRKGPWRVRLWARNLNDEDYGIRGFYFGNDPRKEYVSETYEQFGEPRRVGVTLNYHF